MSSKDDEVTHIDWNPDPPPLALLEADKARLQQEVRALEDKLREAGHREDAAYLRGRSDGYRIIANATRKALTPESLRALADALTEALGLAKRAEATTGGARIAEEGRS